ncbi:ExbD/TolR family protein [Flavobacterium sp. 3-218]
MKNLSQKVRSRKLNSRVDLTAMVSVSFLLIIFFMVTIELSKPKAVDLSLPDNGWTCGRWYGGCGENRSATIIIGDDDKVVFYEGLLALPKVAPKKLAFGKEGIRKELAKSNKRMLAYSTAMGKPNRGLVVIIKPSKKSNFKNLVDILDEMAIANIDTYAIVPEFTPEETKLLASK